MPSYFYPDEARIEAPRGTAFQLHSCAARSRNVLAQHILQLFSYLDNVANSEDAYISLGVCTRAPSGPRSGPLFSIAYIERSSRYAPLPGVAEPAMPYASSKRLLCTDYWFRCFRKLTLMRDAVVRLPRSRRWGTNTQLLLTLRTLKSQRDHLRGACMENSLFLEPAFIKEPLYRLRRRPPMGALPSSMHLARSSGCRAERSAATEGWRFAGGSRSTQGEILALTGVEDGASQRRAKSLG